MVRLVLATSGPDAGDPTVVALARALRDTGLEVVHAGAGVVPSVLAVVAVQEDADLAVLVGEAADAELRTALADLDADDIRATAVGTGSGGQDGPDSPGSLVDRVLGWVRDGT